VDTGASKSTTELYQIENQAQNDQLKISNILAKTLKCNKICLYWKIREMQTDYYWLNCKIFSGAANREVVIFRSILVIQC